MTDGRIAPDTDYFTGERVFAVQLTATIFCQNYFHEHLRVICKRQFPIVI
ncbi:MAG: hypothetical protein QOH42_635 [Blastocatellia bacterium]|nr:hypothetical protein [Blastocatellia bacterium]